MQWRLGISLRCVLLQRRLITFGSCFMCCQLQ